MVDLCLSTRESNCKIENKISFYNVQYIVSKNNFFSSKNIMITNVLKIGSDWLV